MPHKFLPVLLHCFLFGLAGCSGSDESEERQNGDADVESTVESGDMRIPWFEGTVEQAFAEAREQRKPIFLYWGVDWCPPCNQIKATIFNRHEFVVHSRRFVPVYLDGDTVNAQRTGEQFGVLGYPTIIVFNPQGEELTRIPGGIDIQRYTSILNLTLSNIQPVAKIIERVRTGGQPVSSKEYKLLAYYSWGQDNERVLAGHNKIEFFASLASTCPPLLIEECSRMNSEYFLAIVEATTDEENPFVPDRNLINETLEKIQTVLKSRQLVQANLEFVLFASADIARVFTDSESPRRASLLGQWNRALSVIAADPKISLMERLYTSYGRVQMARVEDPERDLSVEFKEKIAAHVDWADEQAKTSFERQAVINAAWNILSEAGMDEKATELLTAELEKSHSPYYFMLDLAELADRSGRTDEAVSWLQRAYDESSGTATRFQWGYNYLVGLLELVPEDNALIEREAIRVFDELSGQDNAFYQRTKTRLGRLDGRFREWNEDGAHDNSIRLIRTKMQTICSSIPETNESRLTCDSFLAEA